MFRQIDRTSRTFRQIDLTATRSDPALRAALRDGSGQAGYTPPPRARGTGGMTMSDAASAPAASPMSASPHLVLIAGVGGLPAVDALLAARQVTPRVSVIFVTAWTAAEAVRQAWANAPADTEFLLSDDLDGAVDAAIALHDRVPVHGVLTYSELLLRPQAEIARRLGLAGNDPEAVAVAQSKARQRMAFAEYGVPAPRFAVIHTGSDLRAAAKAIGFPAVFKPSLGAGSLNVRLVGGPAELKAAYRTALRTYTPFIQDGDAFLLEEPLPVEGAAPSPYADYVSVESMLFRGRCEHLAVTDRLRLQHGYVEEGAVLPSRLDRETRQSVMDCAGQAIKAVGLTNGAVHTEIALTPDGPRTIEVNARAGGPIPVMLRAAAGYDLAVEMARAALGISPTPCPEMPAVAWYRCVPIPAGNWRVVSQRDAEEVQRLFPGLLRLRMLFRPGQQARRDTTQVLASFGVSAATVAAARAIAEEVERSLDIRLEPLGDREEES